MTASAIAVIQRNHVRSPVDVLRLIVGAAVIVLGVGGANLFDDALLGLSVDVRAAIGGIPGWVNDLSASVIGTMLALLVAGSLAWTAVTTRYRRLFLLLSTTAAAAGISIAIGHLLLRLVDTDVRDAFIAHSSLLRYSTDGMVHPGDPLLAAAVATAAQGTSFLRTRTLRILGASIIAYVVMMILITRVPALGVMVDVGIGLTVASLVLLLAGRHDLAPNARDLEESLGKIGVAVHDL